LPVALGIHDGNLQTATAGTAVALPPSVVVTDTATGTAMPVAGATVTFAVTGGGGTITNPVVVTGSDGIARVGSWTLGSTAGVNTLTATTAGAVGIAPVFTATGTPRLP
jgi:adhesin/invasin